MINTKHFDCVNDSMKQRLGLSSSIFRAYDIRGIVGSTLTLDVVEQIGLAIGSEVRNIGDDCVLLGMDGRLSSPAIKESLIKGLVATGCNVIFIGLVPTPVLYYATHNLGVSSGVMITGSHNPANYNGFKIVVGGETLADDGIKRIYNRVCEEDFVSGSGELTNQNIIEQYKAEVVQDIHLYKPLKVVVDCGNGVGGCIAPQIFSSIGCNVVPLFAEVDGHFPNHHPDPSNADNMKDLIRVVAEVKADLGIAFDGDADRIGVVTNEGGLIKSDRLLMLLARDILPRHPGTDVIYDVKCTSQLKYVIEQYGGNSVMWKTGHSFIKKKMHQTGALLAGEMSGHVFIKERWYGFDDAIYTAARVLEILSAEEKTSDAIFKGFPDTDRKSVV